MSNFRGCMLNCFIHVNLTAAKVLECPALVLDHLHKDRFKIALWSRLKETNHIHNIYVHIDTGIYVRNVYLIYIYVYIKLNIYIYTIYIHQNELYHKLYQPQVTGV